MRVALPQTIGEQDPGLLHGNNQFGVAPTSRWNWKIERAMIYAIIVLNSRMVVPG
jgi:hypothetical protein